MAAPAYGTKTEPASGTSTSRTIFTPASTVVGNFLAAYIQILGAEVTVAAAGWTVIQVHVGGSEAHTLAVLYKVATEAGEKEIPITWGGASRFNAAGSLRVTGNNTETPVNVSITRANETASKSLTWNSVTTTVAQTLSILFGGEGIEGEASCTPPAGYTQRQSISKGNPYVATGELAEKGASGEKVGTLGTSRESTAIHLAIAPPAEAATVEGKAALTGTGTLTATGIRTRFGAAALAGTGTLAVAGTVEKKLTATFVAPLQPPPSQITLVSIAEGGSGRGYDLTDEAEGLAWSNVNPGGDEVCTFTISRSWFAQNPEAFKGNLIRVMGGIDVLWQGRVEEIDRGMGDSETLAVTAYGLGNRLGDTTFREIYVDRDLSKWGQIPNPRVVILGENYLTGAGSINVHTGTSGTPVLSLEFTRIVNTGAKRGIIEAWYPSGGINIGSIYYSMKPWTAGYVASLGTSWLSAVFMTETDGQLTYVALAENAGVAIKSGTLSATAAGAFYAGLQFYFNAEFTGDGEWRLDFPSVAVYGRHGLAGKGESPYGFSADQIAGHIISQAARIAARRVDTFAYVIPQFTIETSTTPKDALPQVNAFANADYGTWGPDSPLDNSLNGYFDYKAPDTATQHWFASKADFEDDLGFHTELSSLYDTTDVHWTDESGAEHTERFSIYSPDLREAGLSPRVFPLEAGRTTKAGAQILAEIFLGVFAGFAPARGSGSLSGKVRHYRRGKLPAYYMRADGSNLRISDILPAETAFSLDTTPDRRTTFPIKRVSVDCSGDTPRTTVELDQSTEALSTLLAQEAAQAELVG